MPKTNQSHVLSPFIHRGRWQNDIFLAAVVVGTAIFILIPLSGPDRCPRALAANKGGGVAEERHDPPKPIVLVWLHPHNVWIDFND